MRLHATRESCDAGEITLLAIVETVLAVALLITLSLWLDTARWLAGACLLAPLLLLRTEESMLRGLRWNVWLFKTEQRRSVTIIGSSLLVLGVAVWIAHEWAILLLVPFTGVLLAFTFALIFFVTRFTATLVAVVQHPLRSLAALPSNWRRLVLATDSGLDPEFMPDADIGPAVFLGDWHRETLLDRWISLTGFLAIYPITAAYRWSVKATCVVYLPLLWLVNTARHRAPSVRQMLADYVADDIQRLRRALLLVSSAFLVGKIAVLIHMDDTLAWVKTAAPPPVLKILRTLQPYLTPRHIEMWQVTPVLNGLLAFGMFYFARRMIHLGDRAPADASVQWRWNVMSAATLVLSLYTIVCVLMVTWQAGDLMGTLRKIGEVIDWQWLPHAEAGGRR